MQARRADNQPSESRSSIYCFIVLERGCAVPWYAVEGSPTLLLPDNLTKNLICSQPCPVWKSKDDVYTSNLYEKGSTELCESMQCTF